MDTEKLNNQPKEKAFSPTSCSNCNVSGFHFWNKLLEQSPYWRCRHTVLKSMLIWQRRNRISTHEHETVVQLHRCKKSWWNVQFRL